MATPRERIARKAWIKTASRAGELAARACPVSASATRPPASGVHRPISSRMPPATTTTVSTEVIASGPLDRSATTSTQMRGAEAQAHQ